jgi:DNA-binding MarR family transcriptional regulator
MPTDNVVPLPTMPLQFAAPEDTAKKHKVEVRLTPKLANGFCAVPSILIQGAHRLRPHEGAQGLTPTEVLVIIHLLDRKWDARMPFPAITTIAEQMGLKPRTVRGAIQRLEKLGYLKRHPMMNGGPNRYDLSGLFAALEKLLEEDVAKSDAEAAAEA